MVLRFVPILPLEIPRRTGGDQGDGGEHEDGRRTESHPVVRRPSMWEGWNGGGRWALDPLYTCLILFYRSIGSEAGGRGKGRTSSGITFAFREFRQKKKEREGGLGNYILLS